MKNKKSTGGLLHNDRLMFILSLLLAIGAWAVVVYGPSNEQERTISGVPVTVSLGSYATETLNMKILDEQSLTASVTVYGRRSVVGRLTAQDILLTVDTSTVIAPGSYSGLSVRASKNGQTTDYEIVSIEPTSASLTCDIWTEATFAVATDIPHITSADETKYQLGTPVVSSDAMDNGSITITGPKTEIDRIASVVAVVEEESTLSATEVFDATLKALDADGKETDISHCTMNEDNAPVTVTVPILFYRRVELADHLKLEHAPSAYNNKQLVAFSPTYLELWGANENIDAFVTQLDELFTFDFDNINPNHLEQVRKLPTSDTLKILGGVDTVKVTFKLRNVSVKRLNLQLNSSNTQIINCPKGVTVRPTETTLNNITLYGASASIRRIKASDLRVVVDAANDTVSGQKTLISRITIPKYPNVWVYYGETASGYDLLATVNGTG